MYDYISNQRADDIGRALLFLIDEMEAALREAEAFRRLHCLKERLSARPDATVSELTAMAADTRDIEVLEIEDFLQQTNRGRITDVLNDERKFLPVQTVEGNFIAVAKSAIQKVSPHNPDPAPYRGADPWRVLGVQEGITADELKQAYHELVRTHHPDRMKSLGFGSDYQELATKNMARINNAYAEVLKKLRN